MRLLMLGVAYLLVVSFATAQPVVAAKECDKLPEFPGGSAELLNYITKTLKYPKVELQSNNRDRILVKFIINSKGFVTDPTIVSSARPVLDSEVLRVVRLMPRWVPGYVKDKPVSVLYTLPILVCLSD